jgi:hypothetical protein
VLGWAQGLEAREGEVSRTFEWTHGLALLFSPFALVGKKIMWS